MVHTDLLGQKLQNELPQVPKNLGVEYFERAGRGASMCYQHNYKKLFAHGPHYVTRRSSKLWWFGQGPGRVLAGFHFDNLIVQFGRFRYV
jgi:hypothetical protein